MRFTPILLSAFPFASWAATIPSADGESSANRRSAGNSKTFSLGQVENKDFRGVDPSMEMLRAFAKFSLALTAVLAAAVESNPALNSKYKSLLVDSKTKLWGDDVPAPADHTQTAVTTVTVKERASFPPLQRFLPHSLISNLSFQLPLVLPHRLLI